ncbi:MAG: GTP cyclohydrolase I FolE [Clostridiales bacterium]|nr:GTP cyclohydrolase I FolE [Clostridiales bacterium]
MDLKKVEDAIKLLLEGLGEDTEREGLKDTPVRVAKMYEELLSGREESAKEHLLKTFNAPTGELVIEKDIAFSSLCEHHLMPFFGKIAIAYIPNGKVVGLSKLARVVEVYARRLQLQERMTEEICSAVYRYLKPIGVMVICEAEHTCMTARGIKKVGSKTLSYSVKGDMPESMRANIFNLIR